MLFKDRYRKLLKSAFCLLIACVMAASASAVFPKRAEAGIAGDITKGIIKGGIKFLDRTVVKLLDKAQEGDDDVVYEKIADLITLPDDKGARELQKTCDEILNQVKDMRKDMNTLNQDLDNSIAAIQKTLDKTNLSKMRSEIDRVVADCDTIIESYQTFINFSKTYADKVVAYKGNPTEQKKTEMDKAAANVEGALKNFEKDAKKADFHTMIERVAQYSCEYYPYYVIGDDPQKLGTKNNGDKVMEYADSYANDVFAFEHQKYDFLVDMMNSTAYAFTKISWTNSMYADYLASEDKLMASDEQSFIRVMNKVLQGVNDVGEQCEKYTKVLMRPYDSEATVSMKYLSGKDYSLYRSDTKLFLETKLAAVDTQYNMDFYQVKPINKPYPYLVLKNGLAKNGPKTEEHLVKMDYRKIDNKHSAEFSTMDMDFYNIQETGTGRYKMPATPEEFSYFINNAYKGVGSSMYRYLTEAGGLDPKALAPSMTTTPLNDWNEAGYQVSTKYSNYHCHYRVLSLGGFNPATPSNFKIDRKAEKLYYNGILVVFKGDSPDKFSTILESRVASGTCSFYDTSGKTVSRITSSPGSQVTVRFQPYGDKVGLILTKEDGTLLETLIDPEMFELTANSSKVAEVTFTVPYQAGILRSVSTSELDSMTASSGAKAAMSADSVIALQPEETPLGAVSFEPENVIAAVGESLVDDFQPNTTGTFSVNLNANAQPKEFTDVSGHPLEDDINFANSWGLLEGSADKKFSPDSPMTRGMIITCLAKLAGVDASSYKSSNFSDIPLRSELRPYTEWAYKKGIAMGHGNWTFKPDEPVTREQMALFITKFAEKAGVSIPTTLGESGPYNDHESISEWASEAVYAIRPSGIMREGDDSLFNPRRAVTKAEGASMLARFIRAIPNS